MGGPLAGVRVIDLTNTVLGPIGTQLLGDAGADVIKIEPPAGDAVRQIGPRREPDMGAYFLNLNRNKRSVVLDLKQAPARAALQRLIGGADVLVHNMRLSAAERLGLGPARLTAQFPRLIHAAATGFRQASTRRDEPAYDDIIQGMSGLAHLTGVTSGADGPRYVPTVLADKITGHVLASSVAMALYQRERSGRGQALHVPMLDTVLAFLLPEHLWGETIGDAEGLGYTRMLTPHRRPYATSDGHLCLIAVTDAQWTRLLRVIDRADLIADPRFATMLARAENIDVVYAALTTALAGRSTAEWLARLADADIPHGTVSTLDALLEDAYLREAGFFQTIADRDGATLTTLAIPVEYSQTPARIRRPAPRLGEHTREVLAEAGLAEAELTAILAGAPPGTRPDAPPSRPDRHP
ncbi:MAG: CoA transferase [Rhodospirillales bacterium]|nr:CoA transferase [Rhodospirillales bacterium]